ncbi:hypothetical protein CFP56_016862 [Quercus suber]|uniref:Uncharacterized protein n=1 Tax=Quercus suber TaxID=58331 RepID=A0AAW0KNW0_QUESU
MENQAVHVNIVREEDDEDFCSCCEDEEVWKETEELLTKYIVSDRFAHGSSLDFDISHILKYKQLWIS